MYYPQPSIEVFGIKIAEPVTSVTDLMVAAICYYAYYNLVKTGRTEKQYVFFNYFFLFMAIATTLGGIINHAFIYALGFSWKVPGWIVSMISIALIERAVILHAHPLMKSHIGNFFVVLNPIELVTFIFLSMYTLNFYFVEAHAAYGLMAVVFSFELYVYIKTKEEGSRLMLIAVFFAGVSAFIHIFKLGINPWFNHFDFSHVFMMVSCWFFYKGAKAMTVLRK